MHGFETTRTPFWIDRPTLIRRTTGVARSCSRSRCWRLRRLRCRHHVKRITKESKRKKKNKSVKTTRPYSPEHPQTLNPAKKERSHLFVEHKERHKESLITHVSPPFAHEKRRRRTSDCTKKARRTRRLFKRRRRQKCLDLLWSPFLCFSRRLSRRRFRERWRSAVEWSTGRHETETASVDVVKPELPLLLSVIFSSVIRKSA